MTTTSALIDLKAIQYRIRALSQEFYDTKNKNKNNIKNKNKNKKSNLRMYCHLG